MGVCSERIQSQSHLSMGQQAHASRSTPCQHLAWRLSFHQHRRRWVTSQAYVATAVLRNEPSLTLPSYSHTQHGQICCTGASVGVWQAEQVPTATACAYHHAPAPKPNTAPLAGLGCTMWLAMHGNGCSIAGHHASRQQYLTMQRYGPR